MTKNRLPTDEVMAGELYPGQGAAVRYAKLLAAALELADSVAEGLAAADLAMNMEPPPRKAAPEHLAEMRQAIALIDAELTKQRVELPDVIEQRLV